MKKIYSAIASLGLVVATSGLGACSDRNKAFPDNPATPPPMSENRTDTGDGRFNDPGLGEATSPNAPDNGNTINQPVPQDVGPD